MYKDGGGGGQIFTNYGQITISVPNYTRNLIQCTVLYCIHVYFHRMLSFFRPFKPANYFNLALGHPDSYMYLHEKYRNCFKNTLRFAH